MGYAHQPPARRTSQIAPGRHAVYAPPYAYQPQACRGTSGGHHARPVVLLEEGPLTLTPNPGPHTTSQPERPSPQGKASSPNRPTGPQLHTLPSDH
eukprot:scaffold89620_cov78-Phaeocystis_antarctica.AAC.3